jgi:RND family efflux transporter MFP subunit
MWPRVALTIVSAVITGCSGPYSSPAVAAKDVTPVPVQIFRTSPETVPEVITATGELLAEEQATIGAKVPGRITRMHVDLGDQVQANQALAEIEKDDYAFRLQQAEALVNQSRARLGILNQPTDEVSPEETAIVRQADAALREARFIFQTTEKLQKEGVLSRIDFEKAQVRNQAAEAAYQGALEEVMQLRAQLSERRAQLALARQNLEDCTVRAPFAGAVTRREAGLGEYLPVNAPVVTLVRQHPLRLRLEVPERVAAKVRIGQRIEVHLQGVSPSETGRVVRISPAIEVQSRSLLIEGEIPNEKGALRPGSFAEAAITVDPQARGLTVPRTSVLSFAGIDRVFVVRDGVLEDRIVKTGRIMAENRIEIVSGLEPGMDIVVQPDDRLSAGQKVLVR